MALTAAQRQAQQLANAQALAARQAAAIQARGAIIQQNTQRLAANAALRQANADQLKLRTITIQQSKANQINADTTAYENQQLAAQGATVSPAVATPSGSTDTGAVVDSGGGSTGAIDYPGTVSSPNTLAGTATVSGSWWSTATTTQKVLVIGGVAAAGFGLFWFVKHRKG